MGFIVTGSITDGANNSHDSYYVRIDHYQIEKSLGHVKTTMGHYTSKEAASTAFPTYQEDYLQSDASGLIPGLWSTGSHEWGGWPLEFPLTQSEVVTETVYSSSFEDQLVDYIDYDDDGNEITAQRTESIEVVHTSSQEVTKSRIDLDQITGSVYDYAYARVKDYYINIYGNSNIQDLD